MGRTDGFTLIELLLVMGILSFLAVFSLPALFHYRSNLMLEVSGRAMVSEINLAQARAMAGGQASWQATAFHFPAGVKPVGLKTFTFSASGFTPPGGSGTQTIINSDGHTRNIVVSNVGRVRIE
jgi:prepilin-type N-terminal cleavage/methylation domain-containing protein